MRLINTLLALVVVVKCIPTAKPGIIKEVTDEVFPEISATISGAIAGAVDSVTETVMQDAEEFLKVELADVPLIPQWVEDKVRIFLMTRVVDRVGEVVGNAVKNQLPPQVAGIMAIVKQELYNIDNGLDKLLENFHNQMRDSLHLPSQ